MLAIKPIVPKPKNIDWIHDNNVRRDKIYLLLCIINYILITAHPRNRFAQKLHNLITQYPIINTSNMGFPDSWSNDKFWSM
ncbi:MAG: hypothetical protein A2X61_10185 [Ignavibacteria bacterium GWB2_35_12]|nr:MAG: hypothetical protein A2X63_08405 [Ignavibacteria bacterium GWA2_35_8]OGU39736.1 MAG: hypothetical protein A2X61_10185 [Ignavibacteria bacterium GWB2_35_12]OGU95295.1 MAG: hypothetical protein A2220_17120 [Ignavibacteria bacterium RIFOXYA2_FULL_35_10]OGV21374.1 MAG: hypothetical protein A2475_15090 [Ignavibacteria bacterium RIFOXYC2_FULL_35_21]